MTMMSAAGSIVKDAAGVASQGARAVLPEWVSARVVGPAPPKAEPPKVKTITELAADAGNPEAQNFQKLVNEHKTEAKTVQQNAPPSPGRSSQD